MKTSVETRFDIDFPLTAIAHVRGAQAAPFYAWVAAQTHWAAAMEINKVLIRRDGSIAGTFGSADEPTGTPALTKAIGTALAATV